MIKNCVIFAITLLTAQYVTAQVLEFKGLPMGATATEFENTVKFETVNCVKPAGDPEQSCWGQTDATYAGQHIKSLSVYYIDSRTAEISVMTFGGTGDIIRSAITSKYGKPTRQAKVSQTMKNGAAYKMAVTEWKTKDGDMISVQDHPAPVNEVYTALISKAWLRWQATASKATSKQKADL